MQPERQSLIEVKELGKAYETDGGTIQALLNVSFSVAAGEFVSIIGPSGCGKSTLIRLIGDLLEPTSGMVTIDGMSARAARRRKMFSYVFQNPVLLAWRKVIDNVQLPLEILPPAESLHKTREPYELLKMVGLAEFARMYPKELSGGMQHRVALARALTYEPRLLLMDEPFAAIDEITRNSLNAELHRLWREVGVTILYITHSLTEAVFLSNRVLVLSARPAQVNDVLHVPFPYPRDESLKETVEFQEMVRWLREKLELVN